MLADETVDEVNGIEFFSPRVSVLPSSVIGLTRYTGLSTQNAKNCYILKVYLQLYYI